MQSIQTPTGEAPITSSSLRGASISTYGGTVPEVGTSDSGVPSTQTYNSTNMSYEPDSDAGSDAAKFEVYRIDTLPDPAAATTTAKANSRKEAAVDARVPQPVRTRTRDHKKRVTADPGYHGASAVGAGALAGAGMSSPMAGAPDLGGAVSRPHREMHDYSADGYDMFDPDARPVADGDKKKKKKQHRAKRGKQAEAMQAASNGAYEHDTPAHPPQKQQEPLRIAIRAQPGAQVSITPGLHSAAATQDSAETEI